jgi:hypothetical protein
VGQRGLDPRLERPQAPPRLPPVRHRNRRRARSATKDQRSRIATAWSRWSPSPGPPGAGPSTSSWLATTSSMTSALPGLPPHLGSPEGRWRHQACEPKDAEECPYNKPGRDERHRGKREESDRRRRRGWLPDYPHGGDGDQPCPYRGDGGDQPYPYHNRPQVAQKDQERPAAAGMIFGHGPQAQDRHADRNHGTRSQARVPVGTEIRTQPREHHDCPHREEHRQHPADNQESHHHALASHCPRRAADRSHPRILAHNVINGKCDTYGG